MARNLTTGLQRGLRRSLRPGLGGGDLFSIASLDLNFARYKTLDPRVTFTRASSGTYVDSQGVIRTATTNEARFDHNPTTGESLGLLVEEARTNLALYSEQFDNTYWQGTTFTRTPNTAIAPDGTLTADKITPNSEVFSNNFTISRAFAGLSGSTTGSFYVKSAGHRYARISNYVLDLFSTQNGEYSIYIGNGWHRIYHTFTSSTFDFGINVTAATPGVGFTGNGVDGVFLWGAQLEAGSFATSYIPTVASTVTRAADVASITGTNFSSWWSPSNQFTALSNCLLAGGNSEFASSWALTSGGTRRWADDGNRFLYRPVEGTVTVSLSEVIGNSRKTASAYSPSDRLIAASRNNSATATASIASNFTLYTPDALALMRGGGSADLTALGRIDRLTFWPVRLPNATLQRITQ